MLRIVEPNSIGPASAPPARVAVGSALHLTTLPRCLAAVGLLLFFAGCSAWPDVVYEPQYHNPWPQLSKVAVLSFNNLSDEPTLDGEQVAEAYYNELQQIPGFEVVPVNVTEQAVIAHEILLEGSLDQFRAEVRRLAEALNVDVVVVGAITDYSPYYPPRMGLAVDWYAANRGFHPIPAGYGLPWGTADEEYIPSDLVREAEFELAKAQLETQTPIAPEQTPQGENANDALLAWPDPKGFAPAPPSPVRPDYLPQDKPIISQVRSYNGHDADFTEALANYFYFRDDARYGGWKSYLQRTDDFIAFCCHMHVTEMLAARGGASETRVVWRWPIDRYER